MDRRPTARGIPARPALSTACVPLLSAVALFALLAMPADARGAIAVEKPPTVNDPTVGPLIVGLVNGTADANLYFDEGSGASSLLFLDESFKLDPMQGFRLGLGLAGYQGKSDVWMGWQIWEVEGTQKDPTTDLRWRGVDLPGGHDLLWRNWKLDLTMETTGLGSEPVVGNAWWFARARGTLEQHRLKVTGEDAMVSPIIAGLEISWGISIHGEGGGRVSFALGLLLGLSEVGVSDGGKFADEAFESVGFNLTIQWQPIHWLAIGLNMLNDQATHRFDPNATDKFELRQFAQQEIYVKVTVPFFTETIRERELREKANARPSKPRRSWGRY